MTDREQLRVHLALIAGPEPGRRVIDVRHRIRSGMRMHGVFAKDLDRATAIIHAHGLRSDTYIGAALRDRRAGGKEQVSRSHLVWAEIDSPDAADRLALAPRAPTLLARSGSPGHLHIYWSLSHEIPVDVLESANRRLAHLLGADMAVTQAASLLRPAGTQNFKHTPPVPVSIVSHHPQRRWTLSELVGSLIDPADTTPARAPVVVRSALSYQQAADAQRDVHARLRAIPTAEYVTVLTGLAPDREGKLCCPLHDERTASFHCYDDGSWYCYGCRAGGSVFDFGSRLLGIPTRGPQFRELRDRLTALLLPLRPHSKVTGSFQS